VTRPIRITTGVSRLSRRLTQKKVRWAWLAERLTKFELINHSYDDYLALPVEQQAELKDVGFMVGGQFSGPKRLQAEMTRRSVITLDIDHIDPYDIDEIKDVYGQYHYAVHSTAKHCADSPRLRLVLPLAKDIRPDEYEPVARYVADMIGMEMFDDTTFQPARIMYWPSCTIDGIPYSKINAGEYIDGRAILEEYDDWTDFGSWPHSSRVGKMRKPVKQAEDPLSKAGIIGAFCRTFDIHSAIGTFELPYEPTDFDNRYRPEGSTGASGAIVYDDVFLYSHHESDVAAQLNLNAFDLVRMHRFDELVAKESDDTPMGERPSFRAMRSLAVQHPAVVAELNAPLIEEMDVIADDKQQVNGEDKSPDELMLTFKDLRFQMNTIAGLDDPEPACDKMKTDIAAAALAPDEVDRLAGMLKDLYPDPKPTKKSIVDSIKITGKRLTGHLATEGTIVDAEMRVIQYALDEQFEGGDTLKRFAKAYWTYRGGLWAIENDERIDGKLVKTIVKLREERPQELAELVATIDDRNTSGWLLSLKGVIRGMLSERESRDDPLQLMRSYPLPVMNTLNCELHFDYDGKMERRKHDPANFYTMQIDTKYKPKAKCPEWDRFCELIFANSSDPEDMQRHLEELGGYVIGTSRWLKTWVLLHGPKDTGKSTFTDVLRRLLGDSFFGENLVEFGHGTSQFKNTRLIGKLVFVDDDFDAGSKLPDGFLKKISEEKALSTDKKHGDGFSFVCRALPIICSNHWPHSGDVTDALRDRALVFPFHHKIAGSAKDDARRAAMLEELPGILNKFIAGLVRLRERGDWDIPMDCADAHNTFEAELNIVSKFKEECIVADPDGSVEPKDAFLQFERWLGEQGFRRNDKFVPRRNGFYLKLDGMLGDRKVGHAGKMTWRGYRLGIVGIDEMENIDDADDWDT
jgi:P4 family phage/plasmid primase-like protien